MRQVVLRVKAIQTVFWVVFFHASKADGRGLDRDIRIGGNAGGKQVVETLPYKVIKSSKQYNEYCTILEGLVTSKKMSRTCQDTIDLLTLLIEKWDEAHNTFSDTDPIELLAYLMKENKIKSVQLAAELEISKSLLSDILHYRRGLSREVIRKLASRFNVSQELFNKPYKLMSPANARLKEA